MAQIFELSPGKVVAIDNGAEPVLQLAISGFSDANGASTTNCLITGLGVRRSSAYQVLHTTDSLYIYSFREKVGALRVSGLTFPASCNPANAAGHKSALDYFEQTRLDQAKGPTSLQISKDVAFQGFLTDVEVEMNDPMTMVGQFSFNFLLLPPARRTAP